MEPPFRAPAAHYKHLFRTSAAQVRRRETHAPQAAQGFCAKKESMRLCVGSASAASTPTGNASTTTPRCRNFSLSTSCHRTVHSKPDKRGRPRRSRRLRRRAKGPPQTRGASKACPQPCRRAALSRFGRRNGQAAPPPVAPSFSLPGARAKEARAGVAQTQPACIKMENCSVQDAWRIGKHHCPSQCSIPTCVCAPFETVQLAARRVVR